MICSLPLSQIALVFLFVFIDETNYIPSQIEQATIQGFQNKGYSLEVSENMLRKSVKIALEARELYYTRCHEASAKDTPDGKILKHRPILVAASVGSYGAYLADGSEYRFFDANIAGLLNIFSFGLMFSFSVF